MNIWSMGTPCNSVVTLLQVTERDYEGILVIMWAVFYCLCGFKERPMGQHSCEIAFEVCLVSSASLC